MCLGDFWLSLSIEGEWKNLTPYVKREWERERKRKKREHALLSYKKDTASRKILNYLLHKVNNKNKENIHI